MRKLTLGEMQALALKHGGKCLSKRYISSQDKLRWECSNGHIWSSLPSSVRQGFWCRKCFDDGRRGNLGEMQRLADSHGGRCLSREYINVKTALKWECNKGHVWSALPSTIKRGSWCKVCSGSLKHNISEMQSLAKQRGGVCLSKIYKDAHTKLLWRCHSGHTWSAKPAGVILGSWCPECSVYRTEKFVRLIFERLFGGKFHRARPSWLLSPVGKPLELDGYLPSRKVAFEYNGQQHYKTVNRFKAKSGSLKKRIEYDKIKLKRCMERGVNLIVVPYTVKIPDIENYVRSECKKRGIRLTKKPGDMALDVKDVYAYDRLQELKRFAKAHGGKCLSGAYINSEQPVDWRCSHGHKWQSPAWRVVGGKWCPKCASITNGTSREIKALKKLQKLANDRGGRCLSKRYKNNLAPVLWQCGKKHRWYASAGNVVSHGSWCPICAGRKAAIRNLKSS